MEQNLKDFFTSLTVIPVSSAECERNFREVNFLKSKQRSRLAIELVSNMMAVRRLGCGPPQFFDPWPFVHEFKSMKLKMPNPSQKIYDRTVKPNVEDQLILKIRKSFK